MTDLPNPYSVTKRKPRRRKVLEIGGQRFDKLTVIGRAGKAPDGKTLWQCLCDCGNHIKAHTGELNRGSRRSCGCWQKPRPIKSAADRFWSRVDQRGNDECWPWLGGTNIRGYGRFRRGRKASGMMGAHQFSYELHHGQIPSGLVVMHRCDNPCCVNPAHLSVGTFQDNSIDCRIKGRSRMLFEPGFDPRRTGRKPRGANA
jgi:hypothetical protein